MMKTPLKTLDETIKGIEYCLNPADELGNCNGDCPYCPSCDPEGKTIKLDVLHYLKEQQEYIHTLEKKYHDTVTELNFLKDENWKDANLPLTWEELKQFNGKPVLVEWKDQQKWVLITDVKADVIAYFISFDVAKVPYNGHLWKVDMGTEWEAYKKERRTDEIN